MDRVPDHKMEFTSATIAKTWKLGTLEIQREETTASYKSRATKNNPKSHIKLKI